MLYCITKKSFRDKLADWPEEASTLYREMDIRGQLSHYASEQAAREAIPEILQPLTRVTEYMTL